MTESFFASLECELSDRNSFQSKAEARLALFTYVEGRYNPRRRHSALGYRSPLNFERAYQPALTTAAACVASLRGAAWLDADPPGYPRLGPLEARNIRDDDLKLMRRIDELHVKPASRLAAVRSIRKRPMAERIAPPYLWRNDPACLAWLMSIGFFVLLLMWSSPIFETNDDVHMSMIAHGYGIASGGSPRLVFSNVLWGRLIRLVPQIRGVPGYSLVTIAVLVVVGAMITRNVLAAKFGIPGAIAIIVLVMGRAILIPQFTINAGLLMVAAIACWSRFDRGETRGRRILFAGCVLAYCSFLVRSQESLLVLGVALPILPWRALRLRRDAQFAIILLASVIGASLVVDHDAYRGAEWSDFNRLNDVRILYNDYGAADHLERTPEILRRHGYSTNDVHLIANWYFEDPEIADPGKLQSMLRELGPLAIQTGSLQKAWDGASTLWSSDQLRWIAIGAGLLALAYPSVRVAGVWVLCVGAFFTLGLIGRPGVARVHIPVTALLLIAPLVTHKVVRFERSSVRSRWVVAALVVAAFLNMTTVFRYSRGLRDWSEDVRAGLAAFPTEGVVVWGGHFPYEAVYPVLGASPDFKNLHLYMLDVFTLAPYSVATAERERGNGFRDRLVSDRGIPIVVDATGATELQTYCRDRLRGALDVLATDRYGQINVTTYRCRRGDDDDVAPSGATRQGRSAGDPSVGRPKEDVK